MPLNGLMGIALKLGEFMNLEVKFSIICKLQFSVRKANAQFLIYRQPKR